MDKKLLLQYIDLKKEIPKLEKRIEKLEKQSSMSGDVVQNGHKRHAVIYGWDAIRYNKLQQLKDILEIRKTRVVIQQTEIEEYINSIEKSDIRQIFEHRYIDNMNWYQIQTIMKYKHEDTARKKHDKFIEENL